MVWRTFEVELPLTTATAARLKVTAPTADKPNLRLKVVTHVFNNTPSMLWCNGRVMCDKGAVEKLGLAQDLLAIATTPNVHVSLWSSNYMRTSVVHYWDKS